MDSGYTLRCIPDLYFGDHACSVFDSLEEQKIVTTAFVREGLARGEKLLCGTDTQPVDAFLNQLRVTGIDASAYLTTGQLCVVDSEGTYVRNGVFNAGDMINTLERATAGALREGYTGLRVTGETSWALQSLDMIAQLIEYEHKMGAFFLKNRCLALCQYDRRQFGSEILSRVLACHDFVIVASTVHSLDSASPGMFLHASAATANPDQANDTVRMQIEDSLQLTERRLGTIMGSVENVSFVTSNREGTQSRIIDFSRGAELMFGYSRDEVIGRPITILYNPKGANGGLSVDDLVRHGSTGFVGEVSMVRKSGERFPTLLSTHPITDDRGDTIAEMAVAINISEGKRTEKALHRSEEKFNIIYDNEMMGVALFDAEGCLMNANRYILRVFGLSSIDGANEFGLFNYSDMVPGMERMLQAGETLRFVQVPFDLGKARQAGLKTMHKSGVIYLDAVISPLDSEAGDGRRGYLLQVREVTEHLRSGGVS